MLTHLSNVSMLHQCVHMQYSLCLSVLLRLYVNELRRQEVRISKFGGVRHVPQVPRLLGAITSLLFRPRVARRTLQAFSRT